jgi:hypothetical protein
MFTISSQPNAINYTINISHTFHVSLISNYTNIWFYFLFRFRSENICMSLPIMNYIQIVSHIEKRCCKIHFLLNHCFKQLCNH